VPVIVITQDNQYYEAILFNHRSPGRKGLLASTRRSHVEEALHELLNTTGEMINKSLDPRRDGSGRRIFI
jgi:hypothetical protein